MAEVWLDVPDYVGLYQVSNLGRVRSLDRVETIRTRWGGTALRLRPGRTLHAPGAHPPGRYWQVNLCSDAGVQRRQVSRLIAEAFLGPCPAGQQVRHLNGDHSDNRAVNLAYGTPKQNAADKESHGTVARGERINTARLDTASVRRIRTTTGAAASDLAQQHGVTPSTIRRVLRGETWRHV